MASSDDDDLQLFPAEYYAGGGFAILDTKPGASPGASPGGVSKTIVSYLAGSGRKGHIAIITV